MKEMSFRLPLQNLINDAPAESVAGLLDRFTISVGDLRKSYENAAEYNINWAYTFNPLRQTPLVRLGDYLLCPIPSFLIRRVTSEIYFDLVRHEDKFSRHYGPAVQNLVGRTFEAQNCNDNLSILGEERFGKRGKEKDSIDWIVSDATGHVFVECKSARIKYRGISDLTDQGFIIGEFHRIRAFALQAYKTLALALAGEYPHWAPDSKPVFVMIVTLEDWQSFGIHIDKHVMEPLRNELKEAGIDPEITISCPLSMCPVHDLEFAAHVFSEATILDVLRQKSEGEYPQWAMATYLGQHYSEHADDFKTVTCTEEWSQIMPKGRSRPRGRI